MKVFVFNGTEAPGGNQGCQAFHFRSTAVGLARQLFALHSNPGEVIVTDEMHNVVFRIYRREENETPVELLA